MIRNIFPFLIALAPVHALACPPVPDHTAALDDLFAQAQSAPTEADGQRASNEMWRYWTDAPDDAAQELLDAGMRARSNYDFVRALEQFDALVDYCPHYAEGYNQRAFVNFLRQDFAAALPDLDAALDLSPRHVGALSGKALTLLGLGRDEDAQSVLREAVKLNPWLGERHLLTEKPGVDL